MNGKKVVLITGASSGMGQAAALLFAEDGHRVYAAARRVDRMEAELAPDGHRARRTRRHETGGQPARRRSDHRGRGPH